MMDEYGTQRTDRWLRGGAEEEDAKRRFDEMEDDDSQGRQREQDDDDEELQFSFKGGKNGKNQDLVSTGRKENPRRGTFAKNGGLAGAGRG